MRHNGNLSTKVQGLQSTAADADPGQQLITVIRKGTRALQQVPAAPDAFVWLRLYQMQMQALVPAGRDQPLWWTLRRPFRALTYDAARLMFTRANAALGANWSLHDLRHSAAYRMARDPGMPLTFVILSFRVSRGCDLRRLAEDTVLGETCEALSCLFQRG